MGERKKIDTGGLTFARLREGGYYYVDKSLLIKDILDRNAEDVYLFTRPRRFGKSTNISMLDAFFNIEFKDNSWFDGLEISEHPEYSRYRNAFPVVTLDLKSLADAGSGYDHFLGKFANALYLGYKRFEHLLQSDRLSDSDKSIIREILSRRPLESTMEDSIKFLCGMLETHYGIRPIVLIDEYDSSVTRTMGDDATQGPVVKFLGRFMSSTLKGNNHLQFAYVTGVMQIAKAQMFSDVNNLSVNNIFSEMSDERFGFTEAEVEGILEYYGKSDRIGEVRQWYDGYRFGNVDVYNPFSVMNYVNNGFVPKDYWMNNTRNLAVEWLVDRVDLDTIGDRTNLVNGKPVTSILQESISYRDLNSAGREGLFSLMAMTGYLNAERQSDGKFSLSVPNDEVMMSIVKLLDDRVRVSGERAAAFARAVLDGDAHGIESMIADILTNSSYFVLRDESSYENIILALLHGMLGRYTVKQERESGNGRADLILTPDFPGGVPIILELKDDRGNGDLEASAVDALDQIHEKKYYMGMSGHVILIGLAFRGKVPCARTEILEL
ncbi:MAG: AAA family ATPase [Thermoplasmata archaeon]|nr:AAA family ATPase [Thermoplasmata archaeon]